ncbi:MAG: transcriptional repressor LexA [Acidobacteria bacterium]|nr:transcriptional repressor LexA [Acidobacteriota bacterium]
MKLTDRQQEILEFIGTYVEKHGVPPSIRDIGEKFHIYPRAAHDHLRALERKGAIKRTPLKSRSVQVARRHRLTNQASGQTVPIVGRIAAGTPILAVENIEGGLVVDKGLFKGDEYFAVQVKGDSMIDAHILEGDYVILRKQTTAHLGDVVAVLVGEDVTLKRFYPKGREVELRPANNRLRPMRFPADQIQILGKMVGLLRKT